MNLHQILERVNIVIENLTPVDLKEVEKVADTLFHQIGLDLEFTRHFLDRCNDPRNGTPITTRELISIFTKAYYKAQIPLKKLTAGQEAVLADQRSFINVPFILKYDKDKKELQMVAKTVMRKKNFGSPDPIMKV